MNTAERSATRRERERILKIIEKLALVWSRESLVWTVLHSLHEHIKYGPRKLEEAAKEEAP